MDYNFSIYETVQAYAAKDLTLENYIGMVLHGANQDLVLHARAEKQKGNIDKYKELKVQSKCITGSAVFESGTSKHTKNIKLLNNLIVIDIDVDVNYEKILELKNDQYTFVLHRSFGGDGICIFVKIDSNKFEDSFDGLADYYYNTFNIVIDQSCKNKNRLRFLSYDPDIFQNYKSNKFIPKNIKKFAEPKSTETNYAFHPDDFDNILIQIKNRNIDLCQEDYHRYVRIGLAIANQFGTLGDDKFHFICSFGSKYSYKAAARDYDGFVKNDNGSCKIGTFYYYCKQAGIDIYSDKTKTIINKVKVGKSQGTPTVLSICSNLKVANHIDASPEDIKLINGLLNNKNDFTAQANEGLSKIAQVENFIIDTYDPYYDEISNYIYINNVALEDRQLNDIYLNCKNSFEFNIPVTDIVAILYSSKIKKVNKLKDILLNATEKPKGVIDEYALLIYPQTAYNVWAFKKWLVGCVHNWLADHDEIIICPLDLVLTGAQHGIGKTSFFRNILPKELRKYIVEEKINSKDKDSVFRLCKSLIAYDDEFGGDGFKDVKAFKALSDTNLVNQRRPFSRQDSVFKRRAGLCGSTNELDILKDMTGNRRILPINITSLDYDRLLTINKTDLIVEAYNLYKDGFEWIIRTKEDIDYIKTNTQQNEVILPIEEIFFNNFSFNLSIDFSIEVIYNQGEILEHLNLYSVMKPTKYELKEVIQKNKLVYASHRIDGQIKKGIRLFRRQMTI